MSLINDALKKAQKQRTGEAPALSSLPSIGGESAVRIAKRDKPAGFNALLLRLGLGAGALLIVVLGGYFALKPKPEASQTPPAVLSTASTPQVSGLRPQVSEAPVAPPVFTLPVAPKPEPVVAKPEPVVTQPTAQVPVPVPAPAAQASASASQVSGLRSQVSLPGDRPGQTPGSQQGTTVPAKLDPKAITYIENLKIAGIRASSTDAKVLMNDRVYRIGSMVEAELGLKLVGITANSLTFENEAGARYTRTF